MEMKYTKPNDDALKAFGRDLIVEAKENRIDPVIGRDEEIRRIIRILSRKTKNNPILVGEPGVGKTAIVEGLARKIVSGDVPENLKGKQVIELDVAALIAGSSYHGEFEKRIKEVMEQIKKADGNIIVFVDEIHTLIGAGKAGGQSGMDAAQIIKPMLARGQMKLIGATTNDEFKKYIETDAAFERRLQKVTVTEPTPDDALTILRGIKNRYENFHKVKINDQALVQAVKLSSRYITDRFLPDKAIDLIDEAAASIQTQMNSKPEAIEKLEHKLATLKMERAVISSENKESEKLKEIDLKIKDLKDKLDEMNSKWNTEKQVSITLSELKEKLELKNIEQQEYQQNGDFEKASQILYKEIPELESKIKNISVTNNTLIQGNVTENDIAEVVSRWKRIPVSKLLKEQKEKLLSLENDLGKRVIGQDETLKIISDAILRSRASISDPNRPIGSFLFMGPTGVGKTEVAKTLADNLFDSEKAITRIDMSEYMQDHSVSRLIGSPPGYVGYDEGGQLTEAIRRSPYSIVLFDEVEKAHPKVLDILLQILDEGQVTDGKGKVVNFKNTIIILTTNIGSEKLIEGKKIKDPVTELSKFMRPEFINRIDEIIQFNPLSEEDIFKITSNLLKKLSNRLEDNGYKIEFDDKIVKFVSKTAFDPAFGARPIRRYIQKNIESKIAHDIISELVEKDKSYKITIDEKNNIKIT